MPTPKQIAADVRYARKAKSYGMENSLRIAWEARSAGIPAALAFALVEQESGTGRNVFGSDPTIFAGAGKVTRAKYLDYRRARRASNNRQMQGVGPLQLTWYTTQDSADQLGGCWIVKYNLRQGFRTLRSGIKVFGTWGNNGAVRRYNGSGAAANAYWRSVRDRENKWHKRLHGS